MTLPSMFSLITPHQLQDFAYYAVFFLGQVLFVLKRADIATRSLTNPTPSRWAYVKRNWVTLLNRMVIEFVMIFYPYRHLNINDIIAAWGWHLPFAIPQSGVGALTLGYLSDSLLDWLGTLETIPGTSIPIPSWLKEQVPILNGGVHKP